MKIFNEIKLAQELIRFPTIKTEDKGIMKFLSRKLTAIGFKCTIIKSKGTGPKPALNLYARLGKSKPHINFLFLIKLLTALIQQATPPFISWDPLPFRYPFFTTALNGEIFQLFKLATVSVWPRKFM